MDGCITCIIMMLWTFRSAVQSRQTSDVTLGVGRTAGSTKVRTPEGGEDTTEKYDSKI